MLAKREIFVKIDVSPQKYGSSAPQLTTPFLFFIAYSDSRRSYGNSTDVGLAMWGRPQPSFSRSTLKNSGDRSRINLAE